MTPIASLHSVQSHAERVVTTLWSYLEAQGHADYLGEAINQLQHSLQTANNAQLAGADDETILAALLHDVGRFIPRSGYDKMPPMIAPDGKFIGRGSHEVFGENYLRSLGFSGKICGLVGAHVWAKRYLTATEKEYYDGLSDSSKVTLKYQGGPFTPEQAAEAQRDPLLREKLDVRRWDDQAKVAGITVPGLEAYKRMAITSLLDSRSSFTLHGKTYNLPKQPVVVICVDGFDPEYLHQGIADGLIPNIQAMCEIGTSLIGEAAMPTFTNPNNCSIITGAPTATHGISGNFYMDKDTGKEHMVLDDSLLRGTTILEQLSKRGVRVAAITAKDKLRRIITHGLDPKTGDVCFSSEYAGKTTIGENGIEGVEAWIGRPAPPQYSGDLSLYVLDAGIKLLEERRADVFYLTLSDYIQHKYPPGTPEADAFLQALDERVGRLVNLGAIVGMTGDHGMSDKSLDNGRPNVLFVQDELETRFGAGCARVICPITDPFVKHHGALGSFVRIHVAESTRRQLDDMMAHLGTFSQVADVLTGLVAAAKWEMPLEYEGDLVVVAVKGAVLGSRVSEHDLADLKGHRLRSHGGQSEQHVPLILNRKVGAGQCGKWRNFDIFRLLLAE